MKRLLHSLGRALASCIGIGILMTSPARTQTSANALSGPTAFMISGSLGLSTIWDGPFGSLENVGSTIGTAGIVLNDEWYLGVLGSRASYDEPSRSVQMDAVLGESRWYDARRRLFGLLSLRTFYGVRIGYVRSKLFEGQTTQGQNSGVELAYVLGIAFPVFAGVAVEFVTTVLRGQLYGDANSAGSGAELGLSFRMPK